MKRKVLFTAAAFLLLAAGCALAVRTAHGEDAGYTRISQDEAREMMASEKGYIIVDVRRPDEYATGHIPGAVCIPNESIAGEQPEQLPDPDQLILVYCRSGNRSRQASKKLAGMGYTRVYEFGGINTWTGETEKGMPESSTEPESGAEQETSAEGESGAEAEGGAEAESSAEAESGAEQEISAEAESGMEPEISEGNGIWTASGMPVGVRYGRMWEYCAASDCTDPELIGEIVDAIRELEVGEPTTMAVDDYTDLLYFTFGDGTEIELRFEENIWVKSEEERYQVEGLSRLRELLDQLMA